MNKGKRRKFREIAKMVRQNWRALVIFELFYKMALAVVFIPLLSWSFHTIMEVSGYSYLTLENVISFALNPLTLLMIIVFLLLAATFSMIDISAIIYTLDHSYQSHKVHLKEMTRFAWTNALRVWKHRTFC